MSVLAALALTVRRGGRAILSDASATFESGAFVAVIGANGAGKSTFLNALGGLAKSDAGEVQLDGTPLARLPRGELARRRAFLPQNPRCEWPISVERLVALGLTPHLPAFGGLPVSFEPQIARVIEAFDLADRRQQPATTLSGGELARAMLARALVGDPGILIADEPTAGLDPRHALDTLSRLQALAREGRLVIASVHDLTLAARYASHIVALHQGRIVAQGTTASTLTSGLLRDLFEVEACVSGTGEGAYVDFVAPAPRTR